MFDTASFQRRFAEVQQNVEGFIKGKPDVVRMALVCLFAQGHLLIEDCPGLAKTSLAKSIANSVENGRFQRVQFTPDLLPSDITGTDVFNMENGRKEFQPGPVFANVLLGDEINRAAPKTQSALLQVMAEGKVTVGTATYVVPSPFLCIATQNPVDHQGTYALPEAQLDRFLMRISVGYPSAVYERDIVVQGVAGRVADDVRPCVTIDEVQAMALCVREVHLADGLVDYIVSIASATRDHKLVRLGISPRGSIALAAAAQARAACMGRSYATPGDVKALAQAVLCHRLLLSHDAWLQEYTPGRVLDEVLDSVPVPRLPQA